MGRGSTPRPGINRRLHSLTPAAIAGANLDRMAPFIRVVPVNSLARMGKGWMMPACRSTSELAALSPHLSPRS